jgi:putative protease
VTDAQGRFVAHDKHVLSMKDNNQSANLRALIDAGARSFKIEGRYKDMGYVKNITAHYRTLFDAILDERPELARGSSGRCAFGFTPDPDQNFNREFTDYFVNGRQTTSAPSTVAPQPPAEPQPRPQLATGAAQNVRRAPDRPVVGRPTARRAPGTERHQ